MSEEIVTTENEQPVPEDEQPRPAEASQVTENEEYEPLEPAAEHEPVKKSAVASSPETVVISRTTFNYAVVAVTFLVIGVVIGIIFSHGQVASNEELINSAVSAAHDQFTQELSTQLSNLDLTGGAQAGLDPNKVYDVASTDDQPSLGPSDALVTIVEFSDFRCPYCGRYAREIFPELKDNYGDKVRFVFRDYPIIGGTLSVQAAVAAQCAFAQGKFWQFHEILYANQDQISEDFFQQTANELGLDMDAFTSCYQNQDPMTGIQDDYNAGRDLSITGTPTFFINGHPFVGAQPYENFVQEIDKELAAATGASDESTPSGS